MERHVTLVPVAEIRANVRRPLVGFREDHAIRIAGVHLGAQPLDDGVRFGKIFSQLVPSRSIRYGMASRRIASTPISSQNRITLMISSMTAGLSKLRSG